MTKKRKNTSGESKDGKKVSIITAESGVEFQPLSLEGVKGRIVELCKMVPVVPEDVFGLNAESLNLESIKEWANKLQAVLEEFNLTICCVGPATYRWGTDRSGAADQNLNVLTGELSSSQDQISSMVSSRLSNVLAPVVELVVEQVVTKKGADGLEIKENQYMRKGDDEFIYLCNKILARNATNLRYVVLSNFEKIMKCITDYLQAQQKDNQSDRGFAY